MNKDRRKRMDIYNRELQTLMYEKLPWEKLSGKTILISGATGMIGKCLIDLFMLRNSVLEDKMYLVVLSRRKDVAKDRLGPYLDSPYLTYYSCNVNEKIPECGTVDYMIHAASNTHPIQYSQDAIGTITSNVIGTKNLLDYAVEHHTTHFCFLSSVEIYGENRGDIEKFNEKYIGHIDCNTLRAGYPESKRVGEALCNAYYHTHHLEFDIPRLSRIYGPTMLMSDSKAISQFLKKATAREDIILKSQGRQIYSYTFVTDAVSGILYSMLNGKPGEAYNVANEESDISLRDLAQLLAKIAGTKVIMQIPEETEQAGYSVATKALLDPTKLLDLGWKPRVSIEEGLRCVINQL